jgi:hypothetical protein
MCTRCEKAEERTESMNRTTLRRQACSWKPAQEDENNTPRSAKILLEKSCAKGKICFDEAQ